MARKRVLRNAGGLLIVAVLLLAACGGGGTTEGPSVTDGEETVVEEVTTPDESGGETVAEVEPTATPEDEFPDVLVLHPEAFDLVANPASGTFVYMVPGMVAEMMEFMLTELKAKGWEELGQPTLMGHLASMTLQMGKSRLMISLQDNEITEMTRVQMTLIEQ